MLYFYFEQDNSMIPLYTKEEFESAPSRKNILPLKCKQCKSIFLTSKHRIQKRERPANFCSQTCNGQYKKTLVTEPCGQCSKKVSRQMNQKSKSKSGHIFCSQSCAAIYNNAHKTHGTRRSKLEVYLEEQIREHYPNLELLCNDKTTIKSELDFYFPKLKFAIELNGIFHYEPIFGDEKLSKIQNNDERKFLLCHQNMIALAIIDSSSCKNITQKNKDKYWGIIKPLIDKHLVTQ